MKITRRPSLSAYDYIIIGSGSAGSALAARLSEDPGNNVLLIEAGPSDRSLFIQMPAALGIPLMKDRYNWKFFGANEDFHEPESDTGVYTPRGRVLGGSSSINGMNWVRGNRADYDGWCHRGLDDWSYAHCLPYFKRSEHYPQGDAAYRGTGGATEVVKTEIKNPLFQGFVSACSEYGAALNPDHNGAHQGGVHETQRNVSNGVRHSASQAYLHDQPQKDNLELMLETRCNAIKLSQNRAVGVTLYRAGEELNIEVEKELIICAGAIQSPHLLMLSGIGPKKHLKEHQIPLIQDLPGVGQNLQDHLTVNISYKINKLQTFSELMKPLGMVKNLFEYFTQQKGLMTYPASDIGVFFKTNDKVETPNAQIHFAPGAGKYNKNGAMKPSSGITASVCNLRPKSRGHLELASSSPTEAPKIYANYLNEKRDIQWMIEGINKTREIFQTTPMQELNAEELQPGLKYTESAQIEEYIKNESLSVYHPIGTCKMGEGNECVVDDHLKVKGISGLRVADASIFPSIISGNTNATCNVIGAKCADLILKKV